jgi:hypothetical protein
VYCCSATTKKHCGAAIAGFQWKPYVNSWTKPAAKGILKEIANHNSNKNRVAPKIRVIYMTRNPIDVLMSQTKHRTSDIAAHCNLNQKGCIERSKQSGTSKIYLETENLLSALQKSKDQQDLVESTLKMFGIDYYRTTYEELYNRGDADEWMKVSSLETTFRIAIIYLLTSQLNCTHQDFQIFECRTDGKSFVG